MKMRNEINLVVLALATAVMFTGVISACGEGLTFDGTNYLQIPTTPELDSLSNHVLISGVFKISGYTGYGQMIFSKGLNNRLFVSGDNYLTYSVNVGDGFYPYEIINDFTIIPNEWYMFVATYNVADGHSDITLLVNDCCASNSIEGNYSMLAGHDDIVLGANSEHNAFWYYGTIAELNINGVNCVRVNKEIPSCEVEVTIGDCGLSLKD
jgi:hypothetical protein